FTAEQRGRTDLAAKGRNRYLYQRRVTAFQFGAVPTCGSKARQAHTIEQEIHTSEVVHAVHGADVVGTQGHQVAQQRPVGIQLQYGKTLSFQQTHDCKPSRKRATSSRAPSSRSQ